MAGIWMGRLLLLLSPVLLLFLLAHVSWSSRAVRLVRTVPASLAPLWPRQRLAAPPTAGLARQRRQRLGWPGIAANFGACQQPACRLVTVTVAPVAAVGRTPRFLPVQLCHANALQFLLCAHEEERTIKRVMSDGWLQMAKLNGIHTCHHVINGP